MVPGKEEAHFWKGYNGKYFGLCETYYSTVVAGKLSDTYTSQWAWLAGKQRWPLAGTSGLGLQAVSLIRRGHRPVSIYIRSKIEESLPMLMKIRTWAERKCLDSYRMAQDSSQHLGCWAQERTIPGSSGSRAALGWGWWRWWTCFLLGHRLLVLLIKAISRMAWGTLESEQFVKPVKQNSCQPWSHPHPAATSNPTSPRQWTH